MKLLIAIPLAGMLFACQPASSPSADSANITSANSVSLEEAGSSTTPNASSASSDRLVLAATDITAKTGDTVCVQVQVSEFKEIISMQYSIHWDAAVITFLGIRRVKLPYLAGQNFGSNRLKEGLLTFLWLDETLKGQSLSDGSPIYDVCFKVIGSSGRETTFAFANEPTPFEAVNAAGKLLHLVGKEGKVLVE